MSLLLFQLTTSRRGRPFETASSVDHRHFNSRPHEEVDLTFRIYIFSILYFNSRPHEEVDQVRRFGWRCNCISTHDLTKRSTSLFCSAVPGSSHFNSRPHEEVDSHCVNLYLTTTNFNSRPHEEVDEGRPSWNYIKCISTHDLTKRSTMWQTYAVSPFDFNSRPHEEVDDNVPDLVYKLLHFNSRPHEEVDASSMPYCTFKIISTHDLTKRSTTACLLWAKVALIFQLTTSRRGRQQFHTTLRHLKLSFLCLYYIFEHFLLY